MSSVDHSADGTQRCRSLLLAFVLMVGIAFGSLTCAAGMASADSHTAAGHEAHQSVDHSGHSSGRHHPGEQPTQQPSEHHAGMSCLVAFHVTIGVARTSTACSDLAKEAPVDLTSRAERPEPPVPKNLLTSH